MASSMGPISGMNQYAEARDKYRPDRIGALFIAESPPSSGGYFYFEKTTGKDHLFRETMKALGLWREETSMPKGLDKQQLLAQFQSRNLFLLDTCEFPVDKMSTRQRHNAILEAVPRLVEEVRDLDPKAILIVKKTVFEPVREGLERGGLGERILNEEPLPFPSHGNQRKFRISLRQYLKLTGL